MTTTAGLACRLSSVSRWSAAMSTESAGDGNRTRIASLEARPGVNQYEQGFVLFEAEPGPSPRLTARPRIDPLGWHDRGTARWVPNGWDSVIAQVEGASGSNAGSNPPHCQLGNRTWPPHEGR
jgi:hypothetical protein